VDQLSDRGFPVANVALVWEGLRYVEDVTGRRTTASSLIDGAASGAWFGAFIGMLLLLFVDTESNGLALVASYVVAGAVLVGAWQAVHQWRRRGTRDFSTVGRIEAHRYQVWVTRELTAAASELLAAQDAPGGDRAVIKSAMADRSTDE
jgi:hypothetical protein